MSYSSVVLADTPVVYYHLNDTTTTATDSSGNTRNGTYRNATGYTQSQTSLLTSTADTAVKFIKANSGYIDVADQAALDLANTFSLECWIKLVALGQSTIKGILSKQNGAYYMRITAADKIALVQSQTAVLWTQNTALATVGPHHVVWTKSGTTSVLYVNGGSVAVTGSNQTLTDNADKLFIGSDGFTDTASEFFDGWIDEVAIYNTALSSTQVSAHYNAGVASGFVPKISIILN